MTGKYLLCEAGGLRGGDGGQVSYQDAFLQPVTFDL